MNLRNAMSISVFETAAGVLGVAGDLRLSSPLWHFPALFIEGLAGIVILIAQYYLVASQLEESE